MAALEVFHDRLAFFEDAQDGVAGLAARGLADDLEDLLEALDVALGLLQMLFEAGLELGILRGLGHLRQRFHDLLFGVVDVLEGIEEQVLEGLFGHWVAIVGLRLMCARA